MAWQTCWPEGKAKALTFSYDDGQVYDRRLVEILNRHGLRGTFHLNAGTLGVENEKDSFVRPEEVRDVYAGHEIACHGFSHPFLPQLAREELVREIWEDRRALEGLAGYPVTGHSYPFGEYSDEVAEALQALGVEYARTVENTHNFFWPGDFMRWHPTCHHNDAMALAGEFLYPPAYLNLPLFYIWGHSFEFERENNWNDFEALAARVAGQKDVWYATNMQIKRYICAVRGLVHSADGYWVHNPAGVAVWGRTGGVLVSVAPGETKVLD